MTQKRDLSLSAGLSAVSPSSWSSPRSTSLSDNQQPCFVSAGSAVFTALLVCNMPAPLQPCRNLTLSSTVLLYDNAQSRTDSAASKAETLLAACPLAR